MRICLRSCGLSETFMLHLIRLGKLTLEISALFTSDIPQVAQAPKGAVNMTLRNSVIFIRVCMGIERS